MRQQSLHDRGDLAIPAANHCEEARGFGKNEKQHDGQGQRGKSAEKEGASPSEIHDQCCRKHSAKGRAQGIADKQDAHAERAMLLRISAAVSIPPRAAPKV